MNRRPAALGFDTSWYYRFRHYLVKVRIKYISKRNQKEFKTSTILTYIRDIQRRLKLWYFLSMYFLFIFSMTGAKVYYVHWMEFFQDSSLMEKSWSRTIFLLSKIFKRSWHRSFVIQRTPVDLETVLYFRSGSQFVHALLRSSY